MLALPGKISKRALNNPDLPVKIFGYLTKLQLKDGIVILEYEGKTANIEVSGLEPTKWHVNSMYEFMGVVIREEMGDITKVAAFHFAKLDPPVDFEEISNTIDIIEVTLFVKKLNS